MEEQINNKYKELLFINEGIVNPSTKTLRLILLVHCWNTSAGLQCVGLQEDDPIIEGELNQELPLGWHEGIEGVYSFKYRLAAQKSQKSTVFLFKIIAGQERDQLDINVVSLDDTARLFSATIDFTEFKVESSASDAKNQWNTYSKAILQEIVPSYTAGDQSKQKQQTQSQQATQPSSIRQPVTLIPVNQQSTRQNFDPMRDYGRADLGPNFNNPAHVNGIFPLQQQQPYQQSQSGLYIPQGSRYDPLGPMSGINGIPDDIQPDFFPQNGQRGPFGGARRGPPGGMGGGFGGLGGGFGGFGGSGGGFGSGGFGGFS